MNTYEIMFIFDPTVGDNWEKVEGEIDRLMQRAEAEIIVTNKLDERRLAYEIDGRKRGLYVLTYFRANGDKITALERDARLSEMILRVLIIRADGISEEKMRSASLAGLASQASQASQTSQTSPAKDDNVAKTEGADSSSPPEVKKAPELVGSTTEEGKTEES